MPPFTRTGLRIAGAGAAAAALTLAAGAPAFAQTDYDYLSASFFERDSLERLEVLERPDMTAKILVEGPDPLQGDLIEVTMDFSQNPGIVELTSDLDRRCESAGALLTCVDDGTDDLSGSNFMLRLNLGEQGEPGDVANYTFKALVNGEDEITWDGQITVSDDFVAAPEPENPDGIEEPDIPAEGSSYSYSYLDQVMEGVAPGSIVEADPRFHVAEPPAEDRAATIVTFTDSISLDSVTAEQWRTTDRAYAEAYYDNCHVYSWGVTCLLIDFAPESGAAYGLSDDSPLTFAVTGEGVTEDDVAAYWAEDLDQAELAEFVEATGVGLDYNEHSNLLTLTETEAIEDGGFQMGYGLFLFLADLEDIDELPGHGDNDGEGAGQLPTTGNSSIILISSAAAALLAGAVVFTVLRRRKTAADWE
jgi:LPXTG-motif cell wall-anchored protein